MKPVLAALAAAVALQAAPARAQFEGRLEYVVKRWPGAQPMSGTITTWISAAGARTDTAVTAKDASGPHALRLTTVWKASEPRRTYLVSDAQKAYAVSDASADEAHAGPTWKVERTGSATVAGHACDRAKATASSGNQAELCVARDLGKLPLSALQAQRGTGSLLAALDQAGLSGVPVSWAMMGRDGAEQMRMELGSARKEKVPASRLDVPAGYRQTSPMEIWSAQMTPEQRQQTAEAMKRLQEQLKNMPPEQRKQLEEMMKGMNGGAPAPAAPPAPAGGR
jgi:hypothetical protein